MPIANGFGCVTLFWSFLINLGTRRVGMFSFQDMLYCQLTSVADNHQGILVETFLYRPLLANILSQFLPTLLFLLIRSHILSNQNIWLHNFNNFPSQSIVFFSDGYFDMVIQVNLTVLLVLTTLLVHMTCCILFQFYDSIFQFSWHFKLPSPDRDHQDDWRVADLHDALPLHVGDAPLSGPGW